MDRTLIILALIQLFANIKFSVMGIGTLTREMEATEVGTHKRKTTTTEMLLGVGRFNDAQVVFCCCLIKNPRPGENRVIRHVTV